MRWRLSDRYDPVGAAIADRHYSRQKIGSPQFVKPGRCLVLLTPDSTRSEGVLWVTSWPKHTQHAWPGAWECALFRNELPGAYLSSELIVEAVAATLWRYGPPPEHGMVTFVDEESVRRKRDPGRCFRRAGFEVVGRSLERDYLVLGLAVDRMPAPAEPLGAQAVLVA